VIYLFFDFFHQYALTSTPVVITGGLSDLFPNTKIDPKLNWDTNLIKDKCGKKKKFN